MPEFFTIGVYGADEAQFFSALEEAKIDTFCDLRARRGVRGREYAFVNSKRLQEELARRGIHYLHFPNLAPSAEVREAQAEADRLDGVAKRKRTELGEAFVSGYERDVLDGFDSRAFTECIGPEARRAALFCVEREPSACHRGLLAQRLERDLGTKVTHLHP